MHKHQEPIDRFCSNHILSFCSSQKTLNQGQKLWLAQLGSQAHTLIREGWATWWVVSTRRYLIEQWLPHRQTGFCYWAPPAQVLRERYWICPICLMTTHSSLLPSFPCAYAYLDRRETSQPSPVVGEWSRGWSEVELQRDDRLNLSHSQRLHTDLRPSDRRPSSLDFASSAWVVACVCGLHPNRLVTQRDLRIGLELMGPEILGASSSPNFFLFNSLSFCQIPLNTSLILLIHCFPYTHTLSSTMS